jgi:hypothetical protein
MATTFDTESEAQATAAKLNAAGTRDIRYQVGRYGEKWAIERQSKRTYWGWDEFVTTSVPPQLERKKDPDPKVAHQEKAAPHKIDDEERTNAVGLFNTARSYWRSAESLTGAALEITHPRAPITFLFCHALELYLKAYLRGTGHSVADLKQKRHRMIPNRRSTQAIIRSRTISPEMPAEVASQPITSRSQASIANHTRTISPLRQASSK